MSEKVCTIRKIGDTSSSGTTYTIVTCHFPNTYNCTFFKYEAGVVTTFNIGMYNASTLIDDNNVTIRSNSGGVSYVVTAKKKIVVIYDKAGAGQAVKTTSSTATVYNLNSGESVTLPSGTSNLITTLIFA